MANVAKISEPKRIHPVGGKGKRPPIMALPIAEGLRQRWEALAELRKQLMSAQIFYDQERSELLAVGFSDPEKSMARTNQCPPCEVLDPSPTGKGDRAREHRRRGDI